MTQFSHFRAIGKDGGERDVWVNPEYVRAIEPDHLGGTTIFYSDGENVSVQGKPHEVAAQLAKGHAATGP